MMAEDCSWVGGVIAIWTGMSFDVCLMIVTLCLHTGANNAPLTMGKQRRMMMDGGAQWTTDNEDVIPGNSQLAVPFL